MADAGHAEYGVDPEEALITPAHCEVPEPGVPRIKGKQRVVLSPGSLAAAAYDATEAFEEFYCTNELNRRFQPLFEESELRVTGVGAQGEARVVELADARFFIATLYLPQLAAVAEPHPLIDAFVTAVGSA